MTGRTPCRLHDIPTFKSMFLLFFTEISSKQSIDRARYPTACEPKTFIGVGFKTRRRAVKFSDSL